MKGIKAYRKSTIKTSSNEDLVLRLFEAAIGSMWEGFELLEENNKVDAIEPLQHARNIFSELMLSLNHQEGGDLTGQLHQLYLFLIKEVSRSGFEGDASRLQGAIRVAENLHNGFQVAFNGEEDEE